MPRGTALAAGTGAVSFLNSVRSKSMKTKIIGAAVAAALLGLSGVAFGQGAAAGGAGGSAASGQDTPREASRADAGPGSATGGSAGVVTSGSGSTTVAPTTGTASRCDTLTG